MRWTFIILFIGCAYSISAQPDFNIETYSSKDGLSENTVMDILQDKKGYLWLATWDGLCRFNGYSFKTFKVKPGDDISLSNSRIDQIVEDEIGNIWCLNYGGDVFCFNPQSETFRSVKTEGVLSKQGREIICLEDNSLCLLTLDNGVFWFEEDTTDHQLMAVPFSKETNGLPGNKVYQVFCDTEGNTWLLTNEGIAKRSQDAQESSFYFQANHTQQGDDSQPFFSSVETKEAIWFSSDKGRLWRYTKGNKQFELIQAPTSIAIGAMEKLDDLHLLLVTFGQVFFVYDIANDSFESYNISAAKQYISDGEINLYKDKRGNVWIQQPNQSIIQFIASEKRVVYHPNVIEEAAFVNNKVNLFAVEDLNGNMWIQPKNGYLSYFDPLNNKLLPIKLDNDCKEVPQMLHTLFADNQGGVWFSPISKGLKKMTFSNPDFKLIRFEDMQDSGSWNEVRALHTDSHKRIWVSNKSGHIYLFDQKHKRIGYLTKEGKISTKGAYFNGKAYCIDEDKEGCLWIGTKGNGLYQLQPMGTSQYEIRHYTYDKDNPFSLSNNDIYDIHIDTKNQIWLATYGGGINLIQYKKEGLRFINHRNKFSAYPYNDCYRARYITSNDQNQILVGTTNGLLVMQESADDWEAVSFTNYAFVPGDSTCLSNNDVHYIYSKSKQETYIATFGGGLNKVILDTINNTLRFRHYFVEDGLPSDILFAIKEDQQGRLWISTQNGMSIFYPQKERFENFGAVDFGEELIFAEATCAIGEHGKLYFGSDKGLLVFHPDSINKSNSAPPLVFTDFTFVDDEVEGNGESSIHVSQIDQQSGVSLDHTQNVFSIGFATLEMKHPRGIKYAYLMDGLETEWHYTHDLREASYAHIPYGEYVFTVRSTNSDGVWVDNTRYLNIEIKPPFWQTAWAYVLYVIVFIGLSILVFYVFFTFYKLRNKVRVENELTQMKLSFFTDISHELRTPLTLIAGPVEQALHDTSLKSHTRSHILSIQSNSNRMLRMITQLLDFTKLRQEKYKLRVTKVDLVLLTEATMANFKDLAQQKDIGFEFHTNKANIRVWADGDKLEKIIYNLLSNAFKYLNDGKSISVSLQESNDAISIIVKDSGIGIKESVQKIIFDRFENWIKKGDSSIVSSGIGLSVVKELVELHKGSIDLDSQEGKGSTFKISLQKGYSHYGDDVDLVMDDIEAVLLDATDDDKESHEIGGKTDAPHILIVEDNTEVRHFLKGILSEHYQITESCNGLEALEAIKLKLPDLIISDLMMPEMDGIELLHQLRQNIDVSHTPFIILSAKSTIDNQLEGLEKGADAYITKPFSTAYLLGRVNNLLEQRLMLHEHYSKLTPSDLLSPSKVEVTSLDKQFLEKLMDLMEQNIDKSNLLVEDLVDEMTVSRTVFFKKLKSLTGMSPVEFMRDVRMQRAAQLLRDSEYNISQIAYMVGISDSRYFGKCFKAKYDKTPSAYRKQ